MEIVIQRCAGLDVAKKSVAACVRIFDPDRGRWQVNKRTFGTTVAEVLALRDWLAGHRVSRVGMESTSDYWRPVFYLLEPEPGRPEPGWPEPGRPEPGRPEPGRPEPGWPEPGWECWLLNARDAKNVPGRKTDLSDAEWLSQLLAYGLVRPSYVPPRPQRQLRDLTRRRGALVAELKREKQRLEKFLESTGLKLSAVVSDLLGVSSRAMLRQLAAGQQDPATLAGLARGRLRAKIPALVQALTGIRFGDHEAFLVRQYLDLIDHLEMVIDELDARIAAHIAAHDTDHHPHHDDLAAHTDHHRDEDHGQDRPTPPIPPSWSQAITLLDTVPGVDTVAAAGILAEIGPDMTRFPTPAHLASWAGVCPGNNATGGQARPGKTRPGNRHLQRILGTAALSVLQRPGPLQALHRRIAARRGPTRAVVAVEHALLTSIWHVLTDAVPYTDPPPRPHDTEHHKQRLLARLRDLGYHVEINTTRPAA